MGLVGQAMSSVQAMEQQQLALETKAERQVSGAWCFFNWWHVSFNLCAALSAFAMQPKTADMLCGALP
eukprot:1178628-Prorocentrum_minimum.AAC.1